MGLAPRGYAWLYYARLGCAGLSLPKLGYARAYSSSPAYLPDSQAWYFQSLLSIRIFNHTQSANRLIIPLIPSSNIIRFLTRPTYVLTSQNPYIIFDPLFNPSTISSSFTLSPTTPKNYPDRYKNFFFLQLLSYLEIIYDIASTQIPQS